MIEPQQHTNVFKFFLKVNKKELPWIFLNIIFYSLGSLGSVATAFYIGKVIDALQTKPEQLTSSVTFLILAIALHEIAYRIGHIIEVFVHGRIRSKSKKALFAYTSKLSFEYFSNRFAGQISHQISTAADRLERMEEIVVNKFIDISWLIALSAVALGSLYYPLGIMLGIWFICFFVGVMFLAKQITKHAEEFATQESNTTGALVDMYTNIATVKVYGKNFDQTRVNTQIDKEYKSQLKLGKWSVLTYAYQGSFAVILGILVIFIAGYGYNSGAMSVGAIVAASGITLKIIELVYEAGNSISDFVRNKGECSQALKDIIVSSSIRDGLINNNNWETISVCYNNIDFYYNRGKKILDNFYLTIPAKQRIGIVGLSGAGKTIMINLLLRFFDPQKGSVNINDIDISTLTQESLRSHISFISQDTSLFHMTVAENISYGSPNATQEDIYNVAKMAYVDEFIKTLPDGYNTIVGERGVKLSGGQRQRIAIARAMLKNAPLFLLDEATSALDSDSEIKVQEALKKLMDNKTVITIAHRLSTLQFMDRIIYIENGQVIEDGSHKELLAKNGKYAKLWNMQSGGFLPDEIK